MESFPSRILIGVPADSIREAVLLACRRSQLWGNADHRRSRPVARRHNPTLVYWNAFVPNDGQSLNDLVPDFFIAMFDEMAKQDGTVMMPFPIWRDGLTNDMTAGESNAAYGQLVAQPYKTFTDKIRLSRPPAAFDILKSFINFTEDTGMPASLPWHPRLSQRLGLFRLVQAPGSHEVCFSNPARAADAILLAGQD